MDEQGNGTHQPDDDLARWKQALAEFRAACAEDILPAGALREYLEPFSQSCRSEVLVDLVCEHIKAAWRLGKGLPWESYVAEFGEEFAEFASLCDLPLEMIECEFLARHAWPGTSDHPSVADYAVRFAARPEVRERLGSYRLDDGRYVRIRQEWRGGLGVIWVAYDSRLERYVAIKEPNPELAGDVRVADRLAGEARLTAGLDHPGIIAVHELLDASGSTPCYVMRLVEGGTLRQHVREYFQAGTGSPVKRRLQAARLLHACVDVCDAVGFAHQRGVLHRDLKSSNVVLGRFGETVLLDWGLAIRVAPESLATASSIPAGDSSASGHLQPADADGTLTAGRTNRSAKVAGTLSYMAPEQARGAAESASDIFGLGSILYEVLTGRPPYEAGAGELPQHVLPRVRAADFPRPRQVRRSVPKPLESVCLKAMAAQPEDRYSTPQALADDLRRWLADEPVSVYPNRIYHRLARQFRRHTGTTIAATALAMLLLLLGILAGHTVTRNLRREAALHELQRIRTSERRTGWSVGRWQCWSDRSWQLVHQASRIRAGSDLQEAALAALAGLDARLLKAFDGDAYSVAFSPDGRRLLIGGYDTSGTQLWDIFADRLSPPLEIGPGPVAFTVQGSARQAIAKSPRRYEVWDVDLRAAVCELEIPFTDLDLPERLQTLPVMALSADASLLAASAILPDGQPTLALWNIPDRRLISQRLLKVTALAFDPAGDLLAAGGEDGRIRLWSVTTGRDVLELRSDAVAIESLAFGREVRSSGDPPEIPWLLAAGDAGGSITIWDLNLQIPRSYCRGSVYHVHRVAFSPDGVTLASCGRERLRLWDVASGRLLLDANAGNTIPGLAISPDGRRLAFACTTAFSSPGRAVVLELDNGRGISTLRGLPTTVAKVWFSADSRLLAALSHDWKVAVWDLASCRLLCLLQLPEGFFTDSADLAFDASGQRIAFCAGKSATLWTLANGVLERRWDLPPGLNDVLRFHPHGKLLLMRCETRDMQEGPFSHATPSHHPRVCRIRDLLSPEPHRPLAEITEFNKYVYPIVAPADGKFFIVEGLHEGLDGSRRTARAFDGLDGRELWSITNQADPVTSTMALDPSGTLLLLGRCDDTARLHDAATGEFLRETLEFRAISTGAEYGAARTFIYRLRDAHDSPLLDLPGDVSGSVQPQFSPNGRQYAWGSQTGEVYQCEIPRILEQLVKLRLAR